MDESYAEIGTEVILGKHIERRAGYNWVPEMDLYVGLRTQIARISGRDTSGCLVCRVQCDCRFWPWRVESMILASDVPLLTPEQRLQMKIRE